MKKLLIALALASLLAAGLATANPHTLRIHFDDSGMDYTKVDTQHYGVNVHPDLLRDTAYLRLGYENNALTVFFFNEPQPDQLLTLSISGIPRYVDFRKDPEARGARNTRDSRGASGAVKNSQGAWEKVADIDDVPEISFVRYATTVNHLEIVHHKANLNAVVNLYHNALSDLGFTRVQETDWRNPQTFVYQNGTDRLELRFHSNNGVTMQMRSL